MSIVDDAMMDGKVARLSGIRVAQAGERTWRRQHHETEEQFLSQCLRGEAQ
jgi:hypothetical protein